jgi:hypothetical protein
MNFHLVWVVLAIMPACGRSCNYDLGFSIDMRAIWKGSISFVLVYIPVNLYPATESPEHQLESAAQEGSLQSIRQSNTVYGYTLHVRWRRRIWPISFGSPKQWA